MQKTAVYGLLWLILVLAACQKETLNNCLQSTGKIKTEIRSCLPFHTLVMRDNVNVVLVQDTLFKIELEAGENLLKNITTTIQDSTLTIENKNHCNWLRDYDKEITAYLHFQDIDTILYYASGDLRTHSTLHSQHLLVEAREGCGQIELNICTEEVALYQQYGTADFNISGSSVITHMFLNSYGPFFCNTLDSRTLYLVHRGTNNCHIRVIRNLNATIDYIGNIYLSGNPPNINCQENGTGHLYIE